MIRSFPFRVSVTTSDGFPLQARGIIMPADRQVGINRDYIEDLEFLTTKGYSADFLKLSELEKQRLEEQVWDALAAYEGDSYD